MSTRAEFEEVVMRLNDNFLRILHSDLLMVDRLVALLAKDHLAVTRARKKLRKKAK